MKMKRIVFVIFLVLIFMMLLSIDSLATDSDNKYIDEQIQYVIENIPDDVRELLEENGENQLGIDSFVNFSFMDIVDIAKQIVTGQIESPLKSLIKLISVVVIIAVTECFVPEDSKTKLLMEIFGKTMCVVSVLSPISTAIASAIASINLSESFMLLLLPVLISIVSVSGNPLTAISFQSISFAGAQVITYVAQNVMVPIVGVVLSLDFAGTLMPVYNLSGITEFIKKAITVVMSFSATVFVSFMGIKGALSNAADTVANKGIRLVISSAVPVVGSALSEAYNGILGSMILAKSTLGVVGICVMFLINLPSCIQMLFWIFSLRFSGAVADLFEQKGISALLKSLASSLTLLNVILIFVAVLFIISTALLLVIRAG